MDDRHTHRLVVSILNLKHVSLSNAIFLVKSLCVGHITVILYHTWSLINEFDDKK
jgi:hypothetical protein